MSTDDASEINELQFNDPVSTEEAKKTLLKDQEDRRLKCGKEIEEVLKKYNCSLDAYMVLRNGQQPLVQISILSL